VRGGPRTEAPAESRQLRPRGTGGLVEVRPGVWRACVERPRDPVTGRRRRKAKFVYGTEEEAAAVLATLQRAADDEQGAARVGGSRSVRAAFDRYLADAAEGRLGLRPGTLRTTRSAANTVCATRLANGRRFGELGLAGLGWADVEDLYLAMRAQGHSVAWVRRCATVLSGALGRAVKHGLIPFNPAKEADRPKLVRRKPTAPVAEAVDEVLAEVDACDPELADFATIMANEGMRPAELLALQWADVDSEREEVPIAWAIVDGGPGRGILREPTKETDWRDVPLTPEALAAFARQRARRQAIEGPLCPTSYVFPTPGAVDGTVPQRPDKLHERWLVAGHQARRTAVSRRPDGAAAAHRGPAASASGGACKLRDDLALQIRDVPDQIERQQRRQNGVSLVP
jgi:integrase